MKHDAKTLASRYSDSFEKMNFTQLNYLLETNEVSFDDFLKELNSVEWSKTIEVFKFWFIACVTVWAFCSIIVRI